MATQQPQEEDALLVRLIEEGLFVSHADKYHEAVEHHSITDDQKYLVKEVFPTLVPALHDLMKCYRSRITDNGEEVVDENKQPDPVMWLAQYLLRNNAHHSTSRLASHPFQAINTAVLQKHQQNE